MPATAASIEAIVHALVPFAFVDHSHADAVLTLSNSAGGTDLTTAQRTSLWDTRIDALQQLVGIEATQRLYAARGQSYDAALVTVD